LANEDIVELSKALGIKVVYEHVCLPPVYLLWQDIVFRDYFLPRDVSEKYDEFIASTGKLDSASLVLFDDFTEFQLGACAFPVLDRRFPRCDGARRARERKVVIGKGGALAADAEIALGRSQTAIAFLDRILEVDPENPVAVNLRLSCAEAISSRLGEHP